MPTPIGRQEVQRLLAEEGSRGLLPTKECAEEHLAGAVNIPLKELDERAPQELDRERPVVVYCNDYQR